MLEREDLRDFLDSQIFSDYLLLAGYALECSLKGLVLARKLDTLITTHNLAQLCDSCASRFWKKNDK